MFSEVLKQCYNPFVIAVIKAVFSEGNVGRGPGGRERRKEDAMRSVSVRHTYSCRVRAALCERTERPSSGQADRCPKWGQRRT